MITARIFHFLFTGFYLQLSISSSSGSEIFPVFDIVLDEFVPCDIIIDGPNVDIDWNNVTLPAKILHSREFKMSGSAPEDIKITASRGPKHCQFLVYLHNLHVIYICKLNFSITWSHSLALIPYCFKFLNFPLILLHSSDQGIYFSHSH